MTGRSKAEGYRRAALTVAVLSVCLLAGLASAQHPQQQQRSAPAPRQSQPSRSAPPRYQESRPQPSRPQNQQARPQNQPRSYSQNQPRPYTQNQPRPYAQNQLRPYTQNQTRPYPQPQNTPTYPQRFTNGNGYGAQRNDPRGVQQNATRPGYPGPPYLGPTTPRPSYPG